MPSQFLKEETSIRQIVNCWKKSNNLAHCCISYYYHDYFLQWCFLSDNALTLIWFKPTELRAITHAIIILSKKKLYIVLGHYAEYQNMHKAFQFK
jgi:hypothetical protein